MPINNTYSIKQTSKAWGIETNEEFNNISLGKFLENIKKISSGPMEVTTPGSQRKSLLQVNGYINRLAANGHLVLNPDGIDLRIVPGKVKSANIEQKSDGRYTASLFNEDNEKILSISFKSDENIEDSATKINSTQGKLKQFDSDKSVEELWRSMTDIHHFYPMLQQIGMSKIEVFRSVSDELACQVDKESVWSVLSSIQGEKDKFMVFVGNDSVFQIYTGPIEKLVEINNTDKELLVIHGRTEEGKKVILKISINDIDQAWVVNKNSEAGYITSLEIFDKEGNHIAQFNGLRKEGDKQNERWKILMDKLPKIV